MGTANLFEQHLRVHASVEHRLDLAFLARGTRCSNSVELERL